jgi:hypothetical protein
VENGRNGAYPQGTPREVTFAEARAVLKQRHAEASRNRVPFLSGPFGRGTRTESGLVFSTDLSDCLSNEHRQQPFRMKGSRPARMPVYGAGIKMLRPRRERGRMAPVSTRRSLPAIPIAPLQQESEYRAGSPLDPDPPGGSRRRKIELLAAGLALLLRITVRNAAAAQFDLSLFRRIHHFRPGQAVQDGNDIEASAPRARLGALLLPLLPRRGTCVRSPRFTTRTPFPQAP